MPGGSSHADSFSLGDRLAACRQIPKTGRFRASAVNTGWFDRPELDRWTQWLWGSGWRGQAATHLRVPGTCRHSLWLSKSGTILPARGWPLFPTSLPAPLGRKRFSSVDSASYKLLQRKLLAAGPRGRSLRVL